MALRRHKAPTVGRNHVASHAHRLCHPRRLRAGTRRCRLRRELQLVLQLCQARHDRGHTGGTFTALFSGVGTSIDPQIDYDQNWNLLVMDYDGLVAWKRVNGPQSIQLTPDLATNLPTPTDGGKTYVFHMRTGIHFSNGQLVKPSDVTATLEREYEAGRARRPLLQQHRRRRQVRQDL